MISLVLASLQQFDTFNNLHVQW